MTGKKNGEYTADGRPADRKYLECGLPGYLEKSLEQMKQCNARLARGEEYWRYDCDYMDLNSSINAAEADGEISPEQAWYLRETYLGLEKPGGEL